MIENNRKEFYIYNSDEEVAGFNLSVLYNYYEKHDDSFAYIRFELGDGKLLIYSPNPEELDEDYFVASLLENGLLKVRMSGIEYDLFDFCCEIDTTKEVVQCIISTIMEELKEDAGFLDWEDAEFLDRIVSDFSKAFKGIKGLE